MDRYVEYLRKSRFDRDYSDLSLEETLKRHKVILDKLAKERNYNIEKTYYEVVSGESIAARPEIQKLLEEVGQGIWTGVLVVDVDRLARGNSIDQGIISQTFQFSSTKIITPTKTYDPSNEFDEEYFEFGLFMSRREYKTITRRLVRGRESSASEGKWINSIAPYGYKKVKLEHEKGFTLEPNPDEAPWVIRIFELYNNHQGTRMIANYLNDAKVPTRHGNQWDATTIANILVNPVYFGKIKRGYCTQSKIIQNGIIHKKTKHHKDISEYRIYDGLHPPLITEEMYRSAQEVRKEQTTERPVRDQYELQNPFAGLLFCANCGKRIARTTTSKSHGAVPRMKCINQRNCHTSGCAYDLLEEKILSALRSWLSGYIIQLDTSGFTKEISDHNIQLEQLSKEKEKLKNQLDKAFELVEQGIYTLSVFQDRRSKLENDLAVIDSRIQELETIIQTLQSDTDTQNNLIPKTQELLANYDSLTVQERNNLLKEILVKIEYNKQQNGEIELDIYPRFSKFLP